MASPRFRCYFWPLIDTARFVDTAGGNCGTLGRRTVLQQLEPAVRQVYLSFQYAETNNGRQMEDREAYDWLTENGIDQDKGDLGELTDYDLPPNRDTWRRYVSEARNLLGEQKYTRRAGRLQGKSVVKVDEI